MRALGCLFFIGLLSFIALEVYVYIVVSEACDQEYFGFALLIIASSFFGFKLMRYQASRMPHMLLQNRMGQQGVAIFGAGMIFFPGLVSTVFGLLLQLPPMQHAFANLSAKIVAALIKIAAERMGNKMPGGMGPMAGMGGMGPGMGPMGPGGQAPPGMRPDQQMKGGKVYDTTAEPADRDSDKLK